MNTTKRFEQQLATCIVLVGSIITGVCAITAIVAVAFGTNTGELTATAAKDILTILLPVMGTWIGTVLAFYFSRENYESAARETRLSLQQRLTTPAIDHAIRVDKIKSIDVADADAAKAVPLDRVSQKFIDEGFYRVPIFTSAKVPLHVVHRQPLDSFLAAKARSGQPLTSLTVAELLASREGDRIKNSFVTVPESATLADAKAAMESLSNCQDVFITRSGHADEPIIAWLTNNEIQRASSA